MLIFPRLYFTKVIVFIVFPDAPSSYPPCSHPRRVCRIFLAAVVVCDRWRHLVAPQYKGDNSRLLLGARRGAQWQAACVFLQPCLSLSHAGYQLEADAAHFFFCGVGGRRWEENSWSRGVSSTEEEGLRAWDAGREASPQLQVLAACSAVRIALLHNHRSSLPSIPPSLSLSGLALLTPR